MKELLRPIFGLIILSFCLFSAACSDSNGDTLEPKPEPEKPVNPTPDESETTPIEYPTDFQSDDDFLDFIQRIHINYMWDGADPINGMAPEKEGCGYVANGGTGFCIAGLIVGVERGFLPRTDVVERLHLIVDFLAKAERFHGVWPHWSQAANGKVWVFPTAPKDNGGDLIETSFLLEGLLCARQYFKEGNANEQALAEKIDKLWREVEFDWYLNGREEKDMLFWHWSPNHGWAINLPIRGYNEGLIAYVLAAASPTHSIDAKVYENGWCRNGKIQSSAAPYGVPLVVTHNEAPNEGGPLFFAHFSYVGLNPTGLKDKYTDYWKATQNHAISNYKYCVDNPKHYKGYGGNCWGLTNSNSIHGYAAHAPGKRDLGVIAPTAALSSFPYTPSESMAALKHFYFDLGKWIWGKYGFYDAFSEQNNWVSNNYLAIDQGPIAPMIENHRTGLIWNLFMSCPEIQEGLRKLGFTFPPVPIK